MKAFQKLALVSAIAAAPFAQAELTSIDDAELSGMTGQAGISIDLSAKVSIGSIEYTDTDALDNGTLGINNIVLGGDSASATGMLDEIKIDIDVDATDGLIIHLGGTNLPGVISGDDKVDFGLSVGDVNINGGNNIASNISIEGNLGPIDVVIANDATISVDAYFQVTNGSLDLDVLGVGVSSLTIGQDSNPFIGNQDGQLVGGPQGSTVNLVALGQKSTAEGNWAQNAADVNVDGEPVDVNGMTQTEVGDAAYAAVYTGVETSLGGGDPLLGDGLSDFAYVGMTITTTATQYTEKDGTIVDVANALKIDVDSMSMDIAMDLTIGELDAGQTGTFVAADLGAIAIKDLDLSGTSLIIYGH